MLDMLESFVREENFWHMMKLKWDFFVGARIPWEENVVREIKDDKGLQTSVYGFSQPSCVYCGIGSLTRAIYTYRCDGTFIPNSG